MDLQHLPENERPALPSQAKDHPNVPKAPHMNPAGKPDSAVPNVAVEHDRGPPDTAAIQSDRWPPDAAGDHAGVKP